MGIIKEAIKRECRKKGLAQIELADMLEMKPSNLNNQIGRDESVQFSLIQKICQKLSISVNMLLDNVDKQTENEEEQVIFDQLKTILEHGDEATVDLILGKITREYLKVSQKKESKKAV